MPSAAPLGLSRRGALAAGAASLLAGPGRAAQPDSGPAAPVAALNDALLGVMRAGRATPFAQRAATLAPVVQRSFALEAILRASVGAGYAGFSAADRAALMAAFTDYTVASYVANFDRFDGQRFVIALQTRAVGAEQVVSTQFVTPTGAPTRLDYVMRQGADGWQIVDVLVDGSISRVAVERSDFRSQLAGGPARLSASLRATTLRLASGDKS